MGRRTKISVLQGGDVEATAPARIDLAGGTIDIWPLYLFHEGAITVNAAISLGVRLRILRSSDGRFHLHDSTRNRRCSASTVARLKYAHGFEIFEWALRHFSPETGLTISYSTMIPKGAGLAGSSTLLIALCGALNTITERGYPRRKLIEIARDIETQVLGVPAGYQDYYPATWGGVSSIWWGIGGGRRDPINVPCHDLEQWLMLVYTNTSRYSGANNWNIVRRHIEGDRRVRKLLERIVDVTHTMRRALIDGDYRRAGEAMGREAAYRKQLLAGITTPEIRRLERSAHEAGAIATKVCGAGGGGCVLLFVEPERRASVTECLRSEGFEVVPFRICTRGLAIRTGSMADSMETWK